MPMTPAEAAGYRAGLEAAARVVEQPPCPDTRQDVAAAIRALPVPSGGEVDGTWVTDVFRPLPQEECDALREVMDSYPSEPDGEVDDGDLPNEVMRTVGRNWLERYGGNPTEDHAFIAAAVYRLMRLAKRNPEHPELAALRAARGQG